MSKSRQPLRRIFVDGVSASMLLATALTLTAQQSHATATDKVKQPAKAAAKAAPSASVVINLIRLLVQQGVLTQDKADALIRQAEDEAAAAARGQVAAAPPAPGTTKTPAGVSTSVRVPYIPEVVKKQIREEVKQEVMQQARTENWAAPDAMPEWTKRIKISGDFRMRNEWDIFDKRNCPPDPKLPPGTHNSSCSPNYSLLNSGSPFDLNNQTNIPLPILNTTDDRERQRLRFRLGLTADLDDGLSAGVRLATGNTTNPVSTNQTIGNSLANDSFNLDRAFIKYQPASWVTLWAGRFPNPWLTTDLVWDDDVNFDGVAAQFSQKLDEQLASFLTLGIFPLENTPFNFPDNSTAKASSHNKVLYAAQTGAEWRPDHDFEAKFGVAYYHYQNVEGQTSSPCFANTSSIICSTDNTRPGFIQQGNTLFALRNLVSTATNPPEFQYYGLASQFHELAVTAQFDYAAYDPVHVLLDLDFVTNLGFNRGAITAKSPVNNLAGTQSTTVPGPWDGGANGMQARLTVGYPQLHHRWDWNFYAGYKYLESDAVLDAYTDSDFHLGGTNAKGYFVGGGLGIARDLDLSARWYSTHEITGLPYSVDTVQIDLNGRF